MTITTDNATVRQVQMPHSYFQKAKAEYADWRWALIREFIQNSYDAQANSIDFRLTVSAEDRLELHIDDDGLGMDEDTLLNVLLCMGGSRKPAGAIGGKGRIRPEIRRRRIWENRSIDVMLGLSESLSTMLFNFALLGKRLSLHPAKFAVSLVARSNVQVFADPFHVDPVHVIPIAQRIQVSPV